MKSNIWRKLHIKVFKPGTLDCGRRAWLLVIDLVREVCVCVCPPPRLVITSGVMWHDMDPYDWLNKYYSFCMAAIVGIVSRRGLRIEACHRNQPNKSKIALYKPLLRL